MWLFPLPPSLTAYLLSFSTYISALSLLPHTSPLRPALFLIMLASLALAIAPPGPAEFSNPMYANIAGASVFGLLLQYADQILIGGWSYDTQGPTSGKGGQNPALGDGKVKDAEKEKKKTLEMARSGNGGGLGVLGRLWWGAAHVFNGRFIETPWEVPNVPPFSRRDPRWVPSRLWFVCWRGALFVVNLVLLDALTRPKGSAERDMEAMFAKERVGFFSRLGEVSGEEIVVRYVSSGMFYLVVYVLFQASHCLMSVIMVGLGVSEVKMWRPFIGRLGNAWSVRQFWGSFWHQSLRQMLSSLARFITYEALGFQKGGCLGRYLFIFLTFWLSGLLHLMGELATGLPWYESGVVRFFYTQTLGIMIEDGVQATYRAITGGVRDSKSDPSLWKRVVGWVWVASWISWSLPVNSYPMARRDTGQGVLPFTIVGKFL